MLAFISCIVIFEFVTTTWGKTCDTNSLANTRHCSPTERCTPSSGDIGNCDCLPGFKRLNDSYCVNSTIIDSVATPLSSSLTINKEDGGNGHVVAGVLIPILLIMVVVCGVYFGRKYNLMRYIRTKISQRNNNYDEVMIGQDLDDDDPPLP